MGYRIKRLQDLARGARLSKELLARDHWPRELVEHLQRERLSELAAYARERSPFWRERLPSGEFELGDVPALTKSDLMERFDDAVTDRRLRLDELLEHLNQIHDDALYLGEYRVMTTSGSSGRKAVFVYDRPAWSGVAGMFLRRSAWVGLRPRLPRARLAMIGGAAPTHMTRRGAQSLDVGVHRIQSLSATQPLNELVRSLNDFQPDFLNLYPSTAGLVREWSRMQ